LSALRTAGVGSVNEGRNHAANVHSSQDEASNTVTGVDQEDRAAQSGQGNYETENETQPTSLNIVSNYCSFKVNAVV
jgi:hypothetical protein